MVSKFTPLTVKVLGAPLVAVVNVTVATTPAAPAKLLDSTMEGLVSTVAKIAGYATFETVSIPTAPAVNVEIAMPVLAAEAVAEFLSAANRQIICVPEATDTAFVILSTRLVVKIEVVPAPSPVQLRAEVMCAVVKVFPFVISAALKYM